MKSVETKKKRKLAHFTSQGHGEALKDFAAFMNPNKKVDTLHIDSRRRQQLIKEADDAIFTREWSVSFLIFCRTLAVQVIAFCGETDESSNCYKWSN